MIQHDPSDNTTLFYIDPHGIKVSASPMQGERYLSMLQAMEAQQQAGRDNLAAVTDYMTKLGNLQAAIDEGRAQGLTPPPKPQRLVVFDDGSTSRTPYEPTLPDPQYPTITPSNVGLKPAPAPPDKLDAVLSLVALLHSKVDRLLAK